MRLFYEAWSDLFNSSAKADDLRGNDSSAAADKLLRGDGDNPTVGLLICKTAKNTIVEWSLQDINKPLGVATYQLEEVVERTVKEIEMRNP